MEYHRNLVSTGADGVRSIITEDGEVPLDQYRAEQAARYAAAGYVDDDEDDDEDEDNYLDEVGTEYGYEGTLVADDVFEDTLKFYGIRQKFPTQHILKVIGYSGRNFQELDEWLKDNMRAEYKRVGWSSGCSTTVAVVFWDATDAVLYRMRWQ